MVPKHQDSARSHCVTTWVAAIAMMCALGLGGRVFAQTTDSSDPWAGIEEMVVLGTGTLQDWQQGPTSVVSFDADTLRGERISDIGDVADFTPNLEIIAPGTVPVLFIRGVGLNDLNANATSAVAVYQDGIYMNSPAGQLFGFFDTKGVQVLRGPHGGPYRNATAGAILVESAPPSFEPTAFATFSYGNYNLRESEGALTGPIAEDWLAYRFSYKVTERDGVTKNRCDGRPLDPGNPFRGGTCKALRFSSRSIGFPQEVPGRVNDVGSWALRAQLLSADVPIGSTHAEFLVNGHFGRVDQGSFQFQNRGFRLPNNQALEKVPSVDRSRYSDTDGEPFQGDFNFDGPEKLDVGGASLRIRWELSDAHEILSLSGYEWHDRDSTQNSDGNSQNLAAQRFTDEAWQFSTDLRLESDWSENLSTIVGGYLIMEDLDAFNVFEQPQSQGAQGLILDQDMTQKTRGYAAFADVTWEPFAGWMFHADARFNQERKRLENFATSGQPRTGIRSGENNGAESDTWRDFSGSASMTYAPTDWFSLYVKYSRGWKPGHFNGGAILSRTLITPVDPESVDNVEVGFRSDWFDGRLGLDAGFFYAEYTDQQIFQVRVGESGGPPLPQLINAEAARILGMEADLTASPIEGLDIQLSMAFLDTEYEEFVNTFFERIQLPPGADPRFVFRPVVQEYTGNQLVGAPRWSAVGSIQYTLPLNRFSSELTPRFSFTYKDRVFFDPASGEGSLSDLPENTLSQEAFWLLNASLRWRITAGTGALEVTGWVRNLTNEEYKITSIDVTDSSQQFVLDAYGDPRTYGITLRAEF
jgi:iron complex outermembrane receptor protein